MAAAPFFFLSFLIVFFATAAANFYNDVMITWGDGRGKILDNGELLTLSLDRDSGSGFQSRDQYLFGNIHMRLKLVPGNSAGTVTAYYLSSGNYPNNWDEIDFEFLGNVTGEPYILHTNVFTQGKGNREQQFYLWFDPTADFHLYSVLWNPNRIVFSVDNIPIREFPNLENSLGVPFPRTQPMRVYSSLWNADQWATQGGRVKTDWSKAPFTAQYRGFDAKDSCVWESWRKSSWCSSGRWSETMDDEGREEMRWVKEKFMVYNYCDDHNRFPQGLPKECTVTSSK
ncbi:hypothetical protein Droror1_Dr00002719 [Drosera rotundifolia]